MINYLNFLIHVVKNRPIKFRIPLSERDVRELQRHKISQVKFIRELSGKGNNLVIDMLSPDWTCAVEFRVAADPEIMALLTSEKIENCGFWVSQDFVITQKGG